MLSGLNKLALSVDFGDVLEYDPSSLNYRDTKEENKRFIAIGSTFSFLYFCV